MDILWHDCDALLMDFLVISIVTMDVLLWSDNFTVSLSNVRGKDGLDVKRLKSEQPEVYKEYYKQQNGFSYIKIV